MRKGYDNSKRFEMHQKMENETPEGHCIVCKIPLPLTKKGKIDKRRRLCSEECSKKYWDEFYETVSWQWIASKRQEIDHYTCQVCGKDLHGDEGWNRKAEVHHIKPIKDGGDEFDINNCITLCHNCHMIQHKKGDWVEEISQ